MKFTVELKDEQLVAAITALRASVTNNRDVLRLMINRSDLTAQGCRCYVMVMEDTLKLLQTVAATAGNSQPAPGPSDGVETPI